MRVTTELSKFIDMVLPEDTGSTADDEHILSNVFYGLAGFMAQQTIQSFEHGTAVYSSGTATRSVVGIALGAAGVYYRERSLRSADGQ